MANTSAALNGGQLKEHYALCIQLCSTNKINTKNAFGLHIIDHMNQFTKNQKDGNLNFKLVSSTLDIGTKIYSNRVDSVNTQAQKVASNLHHALDDKKTGTDQADGDDEDGEENGEDQQRKKPKHRAQKKNKTLGTKESITLSQLEYTGEQDQLFLKLSSTVDVGAANSFLIETLDIDSTYTFRIDSNETYYKSTNSNQQQTPQQSPQRSPQRSQTTEVKQERTLPSDQHPYESMSIDISDFHEKFSDLSKNESLRICPRLDTFSFNNLNDDFDYGQNSAYAFRNLTTMNEDNLFNDELDINENLDDLDADFGHLDGSGDDFGMQNEYSLAQKSMINSDNVQFMLGIIGALSDNPTDYCLFDKKITLAWAGHDYWKPNPVYRMKMNQLAHQKDGQANNNAQEKPKRARKVFAEINFDNYQDEPIGSNKENRLKSSTLQKWRSDKTIMLPEDFGREPSDFVIRFTKDPFNVHARFNRENQENSNVNNSQLFDDNDLDDLNDQDDNSDMADTEFNMDDFDYATQETDQQHTGPMPFIGDNLVDQPQIIPTINLPYTKFAKKIDVKRLKSAIWDLIKTNDNEFTQFNETKKSIQQQTTINNKMDVSDDDDDTIDDIEEEQEENNGNEKYTRFSTIYQQLPKKVNPLLAKNLSAPITLVTLLHVVNEKNLKVEGMEDLSDFSVITKGELFN